MRSLEWPVVERFVPAREFSGVSGVGAADFEDSIFFRKRTFKIPASGAAYGPDCVKTPKRV
jgi:hypothetical protein